MAASFPSREPPVVKISATTSSQLPRVAARYWAGLSATPSTSTHTDALESGNGTAELETSLVAGVGDVCTNCAARLAPEQRYCVECGERRGQSRLPFAEHIGQRTQPGAAAPPPKQRGPRLTANGAVIAGVATLILAMGVGVLIGRSGNNGSSKNAGPAQIIRVPASAAAAGAAGAGAGSGTTTASTASGKGGSKSKSKAAKGSGNPKTNPAADTKQKPGQTTPPSVVKVGSPGHGKGYKNGKFTGDFFGQ